MRRGQRPDQITGQTYLERGNPVVVLSRGWPGSRVTVMTVRILRWDGTQVRRPFRGLRRVPVDFDLAAFGPAPVPASVPREIAESETEITYLGQRYRVLERQVYVRANGAEGIVVTLQTGCADCGKAFEMKTGRRVRWLNRRCQDCKAPGRWVTRICDPTDVENHPARPGRKDATPPSPHPTLARGSRA